MGIADSILPEFDHEMKTTRRVLERVPTADAEWKPHEKSTSMGNLAVHITNLCYWAIKTMDSESLDLVTATRSVPAFTSTEELLAAFDENAVSARAAIAAASNEAMMTPWTLRRGDFEFFTIPRVAVLRSFVMNHVIHHRGQLSVYLRLRDIPVPSIYGPTADER